MVKQSEKSKRLVKEVIWFIAWSIIYSVLYLILTFLLPEIFGSYDFYKVRIIYLLIIGAFFSILSRIIHSLIHKRIIRIDSEVIFFWTLVYCLSIWFFEFLRNLLIRKLEWTFLINNYYGIVFMGVGICIFIKLFRRMEFGIKGPRIIRAPSQIFTGVILIIIGVLCWRFSEMVFIEWLRWMEGLIWSWWIGIGFIIAGFLTLLAWWRNNVLQHRIGVKFGHWN